MSEKKKSKTAVLLTNEHHSDQKKCYKRFANFLLCNRSVKNDNCELNARESGINEDFNQSDSIL